MLCKPLAAAAMALAAATTINATPVNDKRQAVDGNFGLSIGDTGDFTLGDLQTYKLSYANDSAYLGEIKYQIYSELLVVSGAMVGNDTEGGLSFLSLHAAPTGYQYGYIQPAETAPLGFSVPHTGGVVPQGAVTTGFSFSAGGPLVWNGNNKFYACQSPAQAAIYSYQVWWNGAEKLPLGVSCNGPIEIIESDPCARGN